MRIAIFTESYCPIVNGVTRSVQTLVEGLRLRGHEAIVYAPGARGYTDSDLSVRRFPSYRWIGALDYPLAIPFSPRLFRDFAAQDFDLVHAQTPFALGVCGLALSRWHGIPLVATMHTLYIEYSHYIPLLPTRVAQGPLRAIVRWYYNQPAAVVVPSPSIQDLIRDYGVNRPVDVVPTGVHMPERMDKEQARRIFGLADSGHLLLYVGRIAREKNISVLLRTFALVRKEVPDARLLIVGGGPARAEAEVEARVLGVREAIVFAGVRTHEDVAAACAAADLFLFPSTTDTQAVSVVEAMAVGTPPIVARAFGPADVVQDGLSGLVTSANPDSMSQAAIRLLQNPAERERLGAGAMIRAKDYSARSAVDAMIRVYETVCGVQAPPTESVHGSSGGRR